MGFSGEIKRARLVLQEDRQSITIISSSPQTWREQVNTIRTLCRLDVEEIGNEIRGQAASMRSYQLINKLSSVYLVNQ